MRLYNPSRQYGFKVKQVDSFKGTSLPPVADFAARRKSVPAVLQISKARPALKCSVCAPRYGACVQCAGSRSCFTAFHPLCARGAGLHMASIDDSGPAAPAGAENLDATLQRRVSSGWSSHVGSVFNPYRHGTKFVNALKRGLVSAMNCVSAGEHMKQRWQLTGSCTRVCTVGVR